ncbi:hypothetical protein [Staphylospora marina]|uniref:hypothetical protein n=1 Tax=Staphylospora marina TaxID=2490858 RepID=UPI0013DE0832|nr:hypothetical protein [Staphylospora marina]
MRANVPEPWHGLLAPARNRLWIIRGIRGMKLFFGGGMAWMIAVLLFARVVPVADPVTWAGSGATGILLAGVIRALLGKPSWTETVKVLDRALGLEDRLVTAWQYRDSRHPVAAVQREDAFVRGQERMSRLPREMPLPRPTRGDIKWVVPSVCVLLALLLLPNPLQEQALKQERIRNRIEERIRDVEKWKETVEKDRMASRETKEALKKELDSLTGRLREAKSLEEAAVELALTEKKLRELEQEARQRSGTAKALEERLHAEKLSQVAEAMRGGDERTLSEAIGGLTPDERKKLAEVLERTAGERDSGGGNELREAAAGLSAGTPGAEASAAKALAKAGRELNASEADARLLAEGSRVLAGNSSRLAAGSSSGTGNGPSGSSTSSGMSGNGSSAGSSSSGNGSSGGSEGATGSGTGEGAGRQGGANAGSPGAGGSTGGAAPGNAPGQMVQVPWSRLHGEGQKGSLGGPDAEGPETDSGQASAHPGVIRPYGDVYADYAGHARQALERGEIPADLEWLVREYFSSLEP